MAEESSNVASVAIVILVIAILVFVYFMFIRGGGDEADIEIDLPDGGSAMAPELETSSPLGELYLT